MVDFVPQVALQQFNTLALPARAEYFCTAASIDELHKALDFARQRALDVTVLGGGSNIIFAGEAITHIPPHETAKRGLVRTFQIVKPFAGLNVVDNVQVGAFLRNRNRRLAEAKAREIVEFVGLGESAERLAKNLTTAGRKRLELARALATEPRLLLLDEVMAGLTPTESRQIVEVIKQIKTQFSLSILVIEHVMQAVMSLSDRIAVLHHGELIAIDKPQAIASDSAVIEAYLGKEFEFADHK